MDARRMTAQLRMTHWAQVMRERMESGLSIKAFCKDVHIHENVYFYWQRKLREKTCEIAIEQSARKGMSLVRQGFVEVNQQQVCAVPEPQGALSAQIRIECAGIKITANSAYPAANLAILLKELAVV
jgi:hypothetical protein